jgi:uncharacterized protein (DUF427 family)
VPVYYFPVADVRQEVLEASDHHTPTPFKGEASYWTIRVGDRVADHAPGAISARHLTACTSRAMSPCTGT